MVKLLLSLFGRAREWYPGSLPLEQVTLMPVKYN